MFPLSTVLFPGAQLPLHVFEPRYQALVRDVLDGDGRFGIVLISRGHEIGGGDERTSVGTVVTVQHHQPLADGHALLLVAGVERIRVVRWLPDAPYPVALVEPAPEPAVDPAALELEATFAAVRRARGLWSEVRDAPALEASVVLGPDPFDAAWLCCALSPLGLFDAQRLLEQDDPVARLETLRSHCAEVASTALELLATGREPTLS